MNKLSINNVVFKEKRNDDRKSQTLLPIAIWRWHFYAGLIFSPILLLLAITGAIYLFKPQIESFIYKDYFYVEDEGKKLLPSEQLEGIKEMFPNGQVTRYKPGVETNQSTEVEILVEGQSSYVYVNPYNGDLLGNMTASNRWMNQVAKLHGELMVGISGDLLIELSVCWGLILLITGIYLWWPLRKGAFRKLILKRNHGKRAFWLNFHAVTGLCMSLGIAFLILTGLPWTGFWGQQLQKIGEITEIGYPAPVWGGGKPESTIPNNTAEYKVSTISIDEIIKISDSRNINPGYDVYFPSEPKGIYIVQVFQPKSTIEATLHIDQYSGEVLGDYRFEEYGFLGKAMATGYAIHTGTQFGLLNQILGLIVCIGIVTLVITGFIMWWKRKPSNKLGAPPLPRNFKMVKGVIIIIAMFGVLFPLVGISLLFVLLLDRLVIQRIHKVKRWIG